MLPQTAEWVNSPATEHRFFKNRVECWQLFLCWIAEKNPKNKSLSSRSFLYKSEI